MRLMGSATPARPPSVAVAPVWPPALRDAVLRHGREGAL